MKKYLIIFINLIFIIVGVFAFYKISYKLFDKYNDTRLDPIQISNIKIDSTKNYSYVFLGDSHCQYWQTSKTNVLNIGVSGQTSEQIKIKTQFLQNSIKGENMVISMGANDVKSASTNPERIQEISDNCMRNINEVLKIVKPKFKNIYIITIPPDFNVGWQQKMFNYNSTLESKNLINNNIRKLAKSESLILIDTEKLLKNKESMSFFKDILEQNIFLSDKDKKEISKRMKLDK